MTAPRDPLAEAAKQALDAITFGDPRKDQKVARVCDLLGAMLALQASPRELGRAN